MVLIAIPGECRCCDLARVRRRAAGRTAGGGELAAAAGPGEAVGLGAAASAVPSRPRAVPGEAGREDLARACQREPLTGIPGRCALWRRGTMPGAHPWNDARRSAWNGSWNGAPGNPRTARAVSAMIRVIGAAKHVGCTGPCLW